MSDHLLSYLDTLAHRKDTVIKGYRGDSLVDICGEEVAAQANKIANFLKEQGVQPGDRVAIIAEKCPETVFSFFGIWLVGGIAVPICETLKDRELTYILEDSGSKVVLCAPAWRDARSATVAHDASISHNTNQLLTTWTSWSSSLHQETLLNHQPPPPLDPDTIAFLIYTSGSTGTPRGVMLTHRNIAINARTSAKYVGMNSSDAVMSFLPYWHSFALTGELFTMLHVGGKIFIPKNKTTFLKDVALCGPTIILSIPRLADVLKKGIEKNLPPKPWPAKELIASKVRSNFGGQLKYFVGGGAPLDASLQQFFWDIGIPMYQGYGLTETSPVISINAPHDWKMATSGKITPWLTNEMGGDYCFEDSHGHRGKGLRGELLVKGSCVMNGYWNMDNQAGGYFTDGWFRTGDVGYLDEDGYLILSGRCKSLICLEGGEKFYPEFVEERLKSSPYIEQAMVVGEGRKRCGVLINVREEAAKTTPAAELNKAIANEIRELTRGLETYQIPVNHLILPTFTVEEDLVTNTQKIRRHKILERYKEEITGLLG